MIIKENEYSSTTSNVLMTWYFEAFWTFSFFKDGYAHFNMHIFHF